MKTATVVIAAQVPDHANPAEVERMLNHALTSDASWPSGLGEVVVVSANVSD